MSTSARAAAVAHYGELARLGRAMSSPIRLQLLDLLRQGARSVEELAEASGVSVANSSRHLQQMLAARLVASERQGRHVQYRLACGDVSQAFLSMRSLAETILPEMDRLRSELQVLTPDERAEVLAEVRSGRSVLLDVRPALEFAAGHVPGAISIPFGELQGRLDELPRDRGVVTCCRGPYCPMAVDAARLLTAAGLRARHLDLGAPELLSGPPQA